MEDSTLMSVDEAASALISYIFSGAISPSEGKGVRYSPFKETIETFSWIAGLCKAESDEPVDRFRIDIDKSSRKISTPMLLSIPETELKDAILAATGNHVKPFSTFTDGIWSISYKVSVQEHADIEYIMQMRHHGNITLMNNLMAWISSTVDSRIPPVPATYPIPGEADRQKATGFGRQIARFIPGIMGP